MELGDLSGYYKLAFSTNTADQLMNFVPGGTPATIDDLGTLVSYRYKSNGLVETSIDANGKSNQFAYDTNGFSSRKQTRRGSQAPTPTTATATRPARRKRARSIGHLRRSPTNLRTTPRRESSRRARSTTTRPSTSSPSAARTERRSPNTRSPQSATRASPSSAHSSSQTSSSASNGVRR